jgi:hypothetical protein
MLKFAFMFFKPWLNISSYLNKGIIILENCIIIWNEITSGIIRNILNKFRIADVLTERKQKILT